MPIMLAKRQQVFRETVAFYAWLRSAPALLALFPLTRFILFRMGPAPPAFSSYAGKAFHPMTPSPTSFNISSEM